MADYGELVPKWFTEYVGLETAAWEVWTYEQEYIPGLLQTKGYTEAVTVAVNSMGKLKALKDSPACEQHASRDSSARIH